MLFILLSPKKGHAQEKEIIRSNQQWFRYWNKTQFDKNWSLKSDFGIRYQERFSKKNKYIARTRLIYSWKENLELSAGFAHLGSYQGKEIAIIESRPFQEISHSHQTGIAKLKQRLSIEERSFKIKNTDNSYRTPLSFRFRYRFMVNIPLLSFPSNNQALSLQAGDEIFIKSTPETSSTPFDQNRLILGPSLQVNDNVKLDFIYMYQYASTPIENIYKQSNIFRMSIKHYINL
ncbi:DUF2490 domain-containing protein [Echinicola marina]|uniref:DUF2490 domain-containing protein n=1 Tax=Echinicola marina TaxID=2859768 RepID=UPI001CF60A7B|nr:DUF2490 domain-containing protein [Echinicola marina]UCS91497.1 DUF2490 domain-containing protein [Echinicola marina]